MYKLLALIFIISSQLFAEQPFQLGNHFFSEANAQSLANPQKANELYQKAIHNYELSLKHSRSSNAYYNLGNAYFRTGDSGRAILNLKKALLLAPRNPDIVHNLDYIRKTVADEFPKSQFGKIVQSIFFWSKLPIALQLSIVFLSLTALLTIKARKLYNSSYQSRLTYPLLITLLLFIISSQIAVERLSETTDGVILAQELVARQGDGLIYEPAFTGKLHNGTEFTLLEKRGSWLQIALPDNKKCWIQEHKAALF